MKVVEELQRPPAPPKPDPFMSWKSRAVGKKQGRYVSVDDLRHESEFRHATKPTTIEAMHMKLHHSTWIRGSPLDPLVHDEFGRARIQKKDPAKMRLPPYYSLVKDVKRLNEKLIPK